MEIREYVHREIQGEKVVEATTRTLKAKRGHVILEKLGRREGTEEPKTWRYAIQVQDPDHHYNRDYIRLDEVDMAHLKILLQMMEGQK